MVPLEKSKSYADIASSEASTNANNAANSAGGVAPTPTSTHTSTEDAASVETEETTLAEPKGMMPRG